MGREACMMTSSNGNIFRVTGPLCGEFGAHRWIPRTKGHWGGALMFSLICAWINGWINNHEAGDLRRHRAHYDVIVMWEWVRWCTWKRHDMDTLSVLLALCEGISWQPVDPYPSRDRKCGALTFLCCQPEQTVIQPVEWSLLCGPVTHTWRHYYVGAAAHITEGVVFSYYPILVDWWGSVTPAPILLTWLSMVK